METWDCALINSLCLEPLRTSLGKKNLLGRQFSACAGSERWRARQRRLSGVRKGRAGLLRQTRTSCGVEKPDYNRWWKSRQIWVIEDRSQGHLPLAWSGSGRFSREPQCLDNSVCGPPQLGKLSIAKKAWVNGVALSLAGLFSYRLRTRQEWGHSLHYTRWRTVGRAREEGWDSLQLDRAIWLRELLSQFCVRNHRTSDELCVGFQVDCSDADSRHAPSQPHLFLSVRSEVGSWSEWGRVPANAAHTRGYATKSCKANTTLTLSRFVRRNRRRRTKVTLGDLLPSCLGVVRDER